MAPSSRSLLLPLVLVTGRCLVAVGQMQHGAALPSWPATWDMGRSTFLMACNNTGSFSAEFAAKWGIADFDWCLLGGCDYVSMAVRAGPIGSTGRTAGASRSRWTVRRS